MVRRTHIMLAPLGRYDFASHIADLLIGINILNTVNHPIASSVGVRVCEYRSRLVWGSIFKIIYTFL